MKFYLIVAMSVFAALAAPMTAQAQGVVKGAQEGAAAGNRAAGPVGGAVGAGVGGVVGGVAGGIKGMLGIPQRTGSVARSSSDRSGLSANQIADQFAVRTATLKAELHLTPEQEKNWPGFESAMNDIAKRNADRQVALQQAATQTDRAQQKGPVDVIEQMRDEAKYLSDLSADWKSLADAGQPLYASLSDQQKPRFAKEVLGMNR